MDPLREDRVTRETDAESQVSAVVLDTNSMGHGDLDLRHLISWAQRCLENDLELWIPEVVLAEWAEHAAKHFEDAVKAAGAPRRALKKLGIEQNWPFDDRQEVMEHVFRSVREMEGVVIVDLHPDDAKEALLDQLLLRPPAKRIDGVKTGAADSAIMRSLHRHSSGDLDSVLVVSADEPGMLGVCERLGWNPPQIASSLSVAAENLHLFHSASPAEAIALCTAIASALPTDYFGAEYEFDFGFVSERDLRSAAERHIPDELN